jgi:hypothetical protein
MSVFALVTRHAGLTERLWRDVMQIGSIARSPSATRGVTRSPAIM